MNDDVESWCYGARRNFAEIIFEHTTHRRWHYRVRMEASNNSSLAKLFQLSYADTILVLEFMGFSSIRGKRSFFKKRRHQICYS